MLRSIRDKFDEKYHYYGDSFENYLKGTHLSITSKSFNFSSEMTLDKAFEI